MKMKKFLPYILILIILVGLFSPLAHVYAQAAPNDFQNAIDSGCGKLFTSSVNGCYLKIVYYIFFLIPTVALWLSAQLFNALISIGLSSSLIASSNFVPVAWAVVRDFSNIFFILILLYVAIQTILGLGHETKKVIVHVVIMALLINFSLFFTKIVIDTSNIIALVFYNKLDAQTYNGVGNPTRFSESSTPNNEPDISGALYKNFNATTLVDRDFLEKLKTIPIAGSNDTGGLGLGGVVLSAVGPGILNLGRIFTAPQPQLPVTLTVGMILISGAIMLYAAWTFFVAGISFLGRLIELWVLIIFSPFAFMSWSAPELFHEVEYIRWDDWFKKLIATSFMAPIFMFFMYLIFMLLKANIFGDFVKTGDGIMATILRIIIPALIILALLKKATHFAEKGGGEFGALVMKGIKTVAGGAVAVGGIASGVGLGLAAKSMQATLGQGSRYFADNS